MLRKLCTVLAMMAAVVLITALPASADPGWSWLVVDTSLAESWSSLFVDVYTVASSWSWLH